MPLVLVFSLVVLLGAYAQDFEDINAAISFIENCVDGDEKIFNSPGDSICDTFPLTADYLLLVESLNRPAEYTSADTQQTGEYHSERLAQAKSDDPDVVAAYVASATERKIIDSNLGSTTTTAVASVTPTPTESSPSSPTTGSTGSATDTPTTTTTVLLEEDATVGDKLLSLRHSARHHAGRHHPRSSHHHFDSERLARHYRDHHKTESVEDEFRFAEHHHRHHHTHNSGLPTFRVGSKRWPAATVWYRFVTTPLPLDGSAVPTSVSAPKKKIGAWDQRGLADFKEALRWWEEQTCADFQVDTASKTSGVILISGAADGDEEIHKGICASQGRGYNTVNEEVIWLAGPAVNAKFDFTPPGAGKFKLTMNRYNFGNEPTADIDTAGLDAGKLKTAIDAVTAADASTVTGTGPYTIEFTGGQYKHALVKMTASAGTVTQKAIGTGYNWETGCPKGTYAHEMGHSLAFGHPMQRSDFEEFFDYGNAATRADNQYIDSNEKYFSSSAFPNCDDPRKARETLANSVMMYGDDTDITPATATYTRANTKNWLPAPAANVLTAIDKLKGQRVRVDVLDAYQLNIFYQCQPVYGVDVFGPPIWIHPDQTLAQLKKKIVYRLKLRQEDVYFHLIPSDIQSFALPALTTGGSFKLSLPSVSSSLTWTTDDINWAANTELLTLRIQAAVTAKYSAGAWISTGEVRRVEKFAVANTNDVTATVTAHGVATGTTTTMRIYAETQATADGRKYVGEFQVTAATADTLTYTVTTSPTAIDKDTYISVSLDPKFYVSFYKAENALPMMTVDGAKLTVSSGSKDATVASVQKGGAVLEVDELKYNGATEGSYTLTVPGYGATTPIKFDATAIQVQIALNSVLGAGATDVSGANGGPYAIKLKYNYGASANAKITVAEATDMKGKLPTVTATITGAPLLFPTDDTAQLKTLGFRSHGEFRLQMMPAEQNWRTVTVTVSGADKTVAYNKDWNADEFKTYLSKQTPAIVVNGFTTADGTAVAPSQLLGNFVQYNRKLGSN